MDINNLYEGIINDKIYVDLKKYEIDIQDTTNNYDNIFSDMSLNYIRNNKNYQNYKNYKNYQNYQNNDVLNIYKNDRTDNKIPNTVMKNDKKKTTSYKFIENSFLKELSNITFLELNEIKEKIKDYVNSTSTNEYLKTLSRSYKKLRIDINNVLVKNLDNNLFNELFNIFCKLFNFNIIVLNEKKNIYIMFTLDKALDYYLFNEIEDDKFKNYKFEEVLKEQSIINILKKYNKKLELNKIKQLKVDELKNLAKEYKVNINQKKQDLLNDLSKFI